MTKQVKTYPIGGNSAFPIECFERKVIREFDGCFAGHVEKKTSSFLSFTNQISFISNHNVLTGTENSRVFSHKPD